MKKLRLVVPLLLLALVVGIGMSTLAQMSEGVLHSAHDAEWTGLDPHVASTVSSFHVLANVVESLTTNNDNIELTPLLATDWSLSDDGLTWTFNLREGVQFSNGVEMTSEHVVFLHESHHQSRYRLGPCCFGRRSRRRLGGGRRLTPLA